jgi:hypothetical protein
VFLLPFAAKSGKLENGVLYQRHIIWRPPNFRKRFLNCLFLTFTRTKGQHARHTNIRACLGTKEFPEKVFLN